MHYKLIIKYSSAPIRSKHSSIISLSLVRGYTSLILSVYLLIVIMISSAIASDCILILPRVQDSARIVSCYHIPNVTYKVILPRRMRSQLTTRLATHWLRWLTF